LSRSMRSFPSENFTLRARRSAIGRTGMRNQSGNQSPQPFGRSTIAALDRSESKPTSDFDLGRHLEDPFALIGKRFLDALANGGLRIDARSAERTWAIRRGPNAIDDHHPYLDSKRFDSANAIFRLAYRK